MKAYTVTVCLKNEERTLAVSTKEDQEWVVDKLLEWSMNPEHDVEMIQEYSTEASSGPVEWKGGFPPKELTLDLLMVFILNKDEIMKRRLKFK